MNCQTCWQQDRNSQSKMTTFIYSKLHLVSVSISSLIRFSAKFFDIRIKDTHTYTLRHWIQSSSEQRIRKRATKRVKINFRSIVEQTTSGPNVIHLKLKFEHGNNAQFGGIFLYIILKISLIEFQIFYLCIFFSLSLSKPIFSFHTRFSFI